MGTVIEFPTDAASRRTDQTPREGTATVMILPVIRIERYGEASDGHGPEEGTAGRRRRRRARS
ncbi:hypothetical protein ASC80_21245 [Afipia sp. Root123D2]|jgi:hypothetical protein|uniref:hypothetical protein n=1 Tax=Afipia sp. Root123D2 TaxID=1736436 RepID=UPI0007149D84|nr:hypothetical protein [Afipia sp. Root123D2]KQW18535.1 hypothetical protein ASC80_21245 [Afipia sp. Root123D2]